MEHFTNIILYLVFCYTVKAISNWFLSVTDEGELFGVWTEKVVIPLSKISHKNIIFEVLYKASGGCAKCNVMWFALILFPVYLILSNLAGVQISHDYTIIAGLWLLSPIIAYDIYTMS